MRYNGPMRLQVWSWRCELGGCGHTWLAAGVDPPAKCAKCKKRGWHKKDIVHPSPATQTYWQTSNSLDLPGIEREPAKPTMQSLRDICAGKVPTTFRVPVVGNTTSANQTTIPVYRDSGFPITEIPICSFKWWEDGERYECLMDAGHSIPLKHGRNGMVRRIDE